MRSSSLINPSWGFILPLLNAAKEASLTMFSSSDPEKSFDRPAASVTPLGVTPEALLPKWILRISHLSWLLGSAISIELVLCKTGGFLTYLPVKSAWTEQSSVQDVSLIGCTNHCNTSGLIKAVHFG